MRYLSLLSALLMSAQLGFCGEGDLDSALKSTSGEPNFLSVLISLVIVIGLIYITGIIYTKLNIAGAQSVKNQFKNNKLDKIVVLSTTQLGQNKNLHIVEINDKKILIGATSNSISLIKELSDEDLLFKPDETCNTADAKKENVMDTLFNKNKSDFEDLKETTTAHAKDYGQDYGQDYGLYKKYLNKDA